MTDNAIASKTRKQILIHQNKGKTELGTIYIAVENFPNFCNLSLLHQKEIHSITSHFQPYSDFNFVNLHAWNTDSRSQVSVLNKNLVIKIPDYVSEEPVYSLIGSNDIDNSLLQLLKLTNKLILIPEVVIDNIKCLDRFIVEEESHNHDYIYRLETMFKLDGHRFKWKRKRLNKITRDYQDSLCFKNLYKIGSSEIKTLMDVFDRWALERKKEKGEVLQERKALFNILQISSSMNLVLTEMLFDEKVIGFSINEVLGGGFANCHFQKSIVGYKNFDIVLTNKVAEFLLDKGCEFVNWEQDLGIAGLHELKSSYCPEFLLKKYCISLKN